MIRKATLSDLHETTALACRLWPEHAPEDLSPEFADLLKDPDVVIFLAVENGLPIGFAQCQLRRDYVEGTSSSPVGYLEGIFIDDAHRERGQARALLNSCEQWSAEQGCTEFASDCELGNDASLAFHLSAGFEEVNRIICFAKKL